MQQRILLGLVEPMNFIDEEDGTFSVALFFLCFLNCFAQVLDSGKHRGEWNKPLAAILCKNASECRFAGSRSAPKDQGWQCAATFEQLSQESTFTDQMTLSDELGKRPGSHPFRQRSSR